MAIVDCPKCKGSKHVRTAKGWTRCDCSRSVTNSLYIKQNIRCGDESYPTELDRLSPLPLKDLTISGEYHEFRKMAWRSLCHYEARDLRYEYMDAYRLVEIFLQQDSTYERVRDLDVCGLVIVALGVSDLPNRMLSPLMCQLLTQRKMSGQPTWVYSSKVGSNLRASYGNELVDLLGHIYARVSEVSGDSTQPFNFIEP